MHYSNRLSITITNYLKNKLEVLLHLLKSRLLLYLNIVPEKLSRSLEDLDILREEKDLKLKESIEKLNLLLSLEEVKKFYLTWVLDKALK